MPKVFQQVEKDGETTYEEVEIAAVITAEDVPEELVKSHPTFQQTDKQRRDNLAESIERRKRIAELEARHKEEEPEEEEPEPAPGGETVQQLSPEELVAAAVAAFKELQDSEKTAAQTRKEKLDAALKEYNLPKSAASAFEFIGDENITEAAKRLSAAGLTFPDGGGGDGTVDNPIQEGLASLDAEFDNQFFGDEQPGKFAKKI